MTLAIATDSRNLALELHRILKDLDPARWRDDLESALRARIDALGAQMARLSDAASELAQDSDLPQRLRDLVALLRDRVPDGAATAAATRARWMAYRAQLHHAYEELSKSLDAWSIHVPSLRPTNYARNVFHVTWAAIAVSVIELVPSPPVLIAIAVSFAVFSWTCETSRRLSPRANEFLMRVFGKVAHPHERFRVNSATWYATALLILSLTVPPVISAVAVGILGVADPAAAIVGRRWGRTRLVNGRSLEGTATFVAIGFAFAAALLLLNHGELTTSGALLIAAAAALPAALAELFSKRVDDNLSIPLAAAAGAVTALHALGLG